MPPLRLTLICALLCLCTACDDFAELADDYRIRGFTGVEPWRRHSSNFRFYRDDSAISNLNDAIDRRIQGLNVTVRKVISTLYKQGCIPLVWGGAVRDAILGSTPFDIDLAVSCDTATAERVCRQHFGQCHRPHNGSEKLIIGRLDAPVLEGESAALDVANWNLSFAVNATGWEYTVDTMGAFLSEESSVLLDPSGMGYHDTCRKLIRIPAAKREWHKWAMESYPAKILRYWKLLAKSFQPRSDRLRSFVSNYATSVSMANVTEFYCRAIRAGIVSGDKCINPSRCGTFVDSFRRMIQSDIGVDLPSEEIVVNGSFCTSEE